MTHNYRYLWLELAAWRRFFTAPVHHEEILPDVDLLYPLGVALLILEFWVAVYISGAMRPI
jgi:hypothetical protein